MILHSCPCILYNDQVIFIITPLEQERGLFVPDKFAVSFRLSSGFVLGAGLVGLSRFGVFVTGYPLFYLLSIIIL